jgi:hypothetical protein
MDSNDFVFSDDVAESLGSRTEGDQSVAENGDSGGSGKAGAHLFGSVGLAVTGLITLLEHQIRM